MKNILLITIVLIFSTYNSNSQSTSEELGRKIFSGLKHNDTTALKKLMPDYEAIIGFIKSNGREVPEDATKEKFETKIKKQFRRYLNKFMSLHDNPDEKDFEWDRAEFHNFKIEVVKENIGEKDSITITNLLIIISHENDSYGLIIETAVEVNGRWYFIPGKFKLFKEEE